LSATNKKENGGIMINDKIIALQDAISRLEQELGDKDITLRKVNEENVELRRKVAVLEVKVNEHHRAAEIMMKGLLTAK
jgi:hypothetical protein